MSGMLASNSGSFILRGVIAIVLGMLAFFFPGPTLAGLLGVFAAYAIIDGALAIYAGAMTHGSARLLLVLGGLAGLAVGVITILSPGTTALVLVLWIGILAIARGVSELASAITFRNTISNAALFGLSGLVSIVFGVYLVVAPGAGALALLWLIGYFALFAGVMYLAVGFRLRNAAKALGQTGHPAAA